MKHWAAAYVGMPYRSGADGPDAFSCWGLVRHVFQHVHGVVFPDVVIDEGAPEAQGNTRAILQCARVSAMRRMPDSTAPADGDIVIMRSLVRLHCGLVIRANGGLRVLHASHATGVVLQHWRDATEGMTAELWRRA